MNFRHLRRIAFISLLLAAQTHGAEVAVKSGIIKGTITVAGKPTADAVVLLLDVPAGESVKARIAPIKGQKAVMDQKEMKFIPHVLAVRVGTTVEFPNHDTSWHNVYSKGGANDFDLGLYPPGKTRSTTFAKPGVARILCNVHPNMEAFIVVTQQSFFSNADTEGNYRMDGVPLGKYRIQVWHPQLGTTETGVELVRAGQVLDLNFDLKKK